ncbi:B-box zinc finger protein 20 [Asimina triloba]
MKIQCESCDREEASVFCSADEAALCDGCDRRVHEANKLAGKHHRFSLLRPSSSKDAPRCDICQILKITFIRYFGGP